MPKSLMDVIGQRGDMPHQNRPLQLQMPAGRGQMPWGSGFEGVKRNMLSELLGQMQQRNQLAQAMASRHMQVGPQSKAWEMRR